MKRILINIVFILAAFVCVCACTKEIGWENDNSADEDGMVDVVIPFGTPSPDVSVMTRGQLTMAQESNVYNIYLLVFDSSNKKIYGHYFEGSNLDQDGSLASAGISNYWTVANMATDTSPTTNGTIHIKTSSATGCTVVAVANMNPEDLDVSPELLSTVKTLSEVENMVAAQVRSEVAANSGYFMMTGLVDGVTISSNPSAANHINGKTLILHRLYAKVTFNVRITEGASIRSFTPDRWQVVNVPLCSYLLERTPASSSDPYDDAATVLPDQFFSTDAVGFEKETLTSKPGDVYADGVTKVSTHSFSFYMMENRKAPIKTPTNGWVANDANSNGSLDDPGDYNPYPFRDRQVKPDIGSLDSHGGTYYLFSNGAFEYADARSTYVVITGKIVMNISNTLNAGEANEVTNDNATLDANVRYVIHLGNFDVAHGGSFGDFSILRNHKYIYNIFINGASDIRAEVEANDGGSGSLAENEPGATGKVVVAMEEVFDCDCHYCTQVISFHADYMADPDGISWYVETPFNPDGDGPPTSITKLDYKWVEFHVNDIDPSNNNYYANQRFVYKPHDHPDYYGLDRTDKTRTMYVDELVDYLRHQKQQYDIDKAKAALQPGDPGYDPDFEPNNDFDNDPSGPKISVTAFVSEFYYEKHPLTNVYIPTLWKTHMVNQPMRRMHILSSQSKSADGESMKIGSSFTLQQRSIQSIYAIQEAAGLASAWGLEFEDDDLETGESTYWKNKDYENNGNTSLENGRLNTLKIWKIYDPDGVEIPVGDGPGHRSYEESRWDHYLNLRAENTTSRLWSSTSPGPHGEDYNYLRYSCLSRNRDNDGDGIIDPEEIRWYMASDIQLMGIFMGSYGIEGDARLYQRSAEQQSSNVTDVWRQHILASNQFQGEIKADDISTYGAGNSNAFVRTVWAEEGINGSHYSYWDNNKEQTRVFSTRCVRNLGYYNDNGTIKDISFAPADVIPESFVVPHRMLLNTDGSITTDYTGDYTANVFFRFDCSRINTTSLREPVIHELVGHDENSKMACLSRGFETAPVSTTSAIPESHTFNGTTYEIKWAKPLNDYLDMNFDGLDSEFHVCPTGYRLPNVRELALLWTIIPRLYVGANDSKSDKTFIKGNFFPSRTHWSFGSDGTRKVNNRWGWGMSTQKLLMANPNSSHTVTTPRCVRDI